MTAPADPIAEADARGYERGLLAAGSYADEKMRAADHAASRSVHVSTVDMLSTRAAAFEDVRDWCRTTLAQSPAPSTWRRIPETPTPGVAPFTDDEFLVYDESDGTYPPKMMIGIYDASSEWGHSFIDPEGENMGIFATHWQPKPSPPPPDEPERLDGPRPDAPDDQP